MLKVLYFLQVNYLQAYVFTPILKILWNSNLIFVDFNRKQFYMQSIFTVFHMRSYTFIILVIMPLQSYICCLIFFQILYLRPYTRKVLYSQAYLFTLILQSYIIRHFMKNLLFVDFNLKLLIKN